MSQQPLPTTSTRMTQEQAESYLAQLAGSDRPYKSGYIIGFHGGGWGLMLYKRNLTSSTRMIVDLERAVKAVESCQS